MTTRLIFCGDVHLADRPPLGRVEGYREQVLAKLEEVGQIAKKIDADAVVFSGDIFHSKRPMFTSHYLVQQVQRVFASYPCPIFIVPGNHDMGPEGMDSLKRQPLGVVIDDRHVGLLDEPGSNPWVIGDATLFARPYHAQLDLDPEYYRMRSDEQEFHEGAKVMVAHSSLMPPRRKEPYGTLDVGELVETGVLDGWDAILSGHIHDDLGVHKVGHLWFANPGALARPSRTAEAMTRRPNVLEIDIGEEITFTRHDLTCALPAAEIFLVPEDGGVVVTEEIRGFADRLAEGLAVDDTPLDQLLSELDGVSDGVKDTVRHYLEEVGVN